VRRSALPFRLHASVACPPAAELAIALAWELGDADPERIERALAALTAATRANLEPAAEAQLRALGETALSARRDGELMIDRVLERGQGHPLLVAIVLTEIGRRAGLPVALVAGEQGHFVAHQSLTEALVLDPATGRLTGAHALGTMTWRCGHQVAAELLDVLQPRLERNGDLTRALHVARLRTTLPFDDTTDAENRLRRVSARLN
jgi:regulator of sirC expression with transglutaminase-like and TPR domain